jgi:signal transduction histidine kinase
LLAGLFAAGDARPSGSSSATFTTVGAIKAGLGGPARRARVDLRAVATFFDARQGVIYLQDPSGAIALRIGNTGAAIPSGTTLHVAGDLEAGATPALVRHAQVTAHELAAPLHARPVSVATLLERRAPAEWVTLRGIVRGVVAREESLVLELEDEGRSIRIGAPLNLNDPCLPGSRVRVRGVSTVASTSRTPGDDVQLVVPDRSYLRMEETPPVDASAPVLGRGPDALPLITRASDLRQLKDVDARRGHPIRLAGVAVCCGPGYALFVHDGSEAVYVESRRHVHAARVGDRVFVTGKSAAGGFIPMVDHPRVRVLGEGRLPPPRAMGPEQLVAAEGDEWVSVEGVVRSVTPRRFVAEIDIAAGGFVRFPFEVPLAQATAALPLIDARVRVRGVRRAQFNSSRQQATGFALMSSGLEMLTVLERPPAAASIPLLPIKALLQFVPGQRWEHQVRTKGVVTYASDGEVYIRDDTGGLLVRGASKEAAVGDSIEVAGFAGPGFFTPVLEDARLLSRTAGVPISPKPIKAQEAVSGRFDGDLVELDARLLGSSAGQDETRLSLQSGPYLFAAVLRAAEPSLLELRSGSDLRLTGICAVNAGRPGLSQGLQLPQGFQVLLRSRGDVQVVRAGPWWTSRRATLLLSAVAGVAVLTFAWVLALRRRLRAQSAIIWGRVKRETELQERQRMARELHDTLEQTLTGVSLSLEAASLKLATSPQTAELLLERAIRRVGQSIDEVRRVVWALRDESLDLRGLAASLQEIGRQLASCHSEAIDVEVAVEGNAQPFVVPVENNLLRIGQEALTNAVKHGRPSRIDVRLHYDPARFKMVVSDDGLGFDTEHPAPAGHFGLAGMRERAAEIGARLELLSRVNGGTEVQVTLDLGDQP